MLPLDHIIVGDSAFTLRTYVMKPYGERDADHTKTVFNYGLSQARRIVENAFGILTWIARG